MVKRVEITYVGGHKEIIRYNIEWDVDDNGIKRFRYIGKDTKVSMNKVLQIKEL